MPQALTYRQVRDLYDNLKDAGIVTQSLPDWSSEMNRITQSDVYGAGGNDNFIKRFNVGLDRLIEKTGAPEVGGAFGAAVGDLFGKEQLGREVGETMPRMAVDFMSMLLPGGAPVRLGALAAMSGSNTYTQTGSPGAGVATGALMAALPWVTGKAEQAILSKIGAEKVVGDALTKKGLQHVNQWMPKNALQDATAFVGGNVAAAGMFGASSMAQQALDPNQDVDWGHMLSSDFAFENALIALPFGVMRGVGRLRGPGYGESIAKLQAEVNAGAAHLAERRMKEELDARMKEGYDFSPAAFKEKVEQQSAKVAAIHSKLLRIATDDERTSARGWLTELDRLSEPNRVMTDADVARVAKLNEEIGNLPFDAVRWSKTNPAPHEFVEGKVRFVSDNGAAMVDLADGRTVQVAPSILPPDYATRIAGKVAIPTSKRLITERTNDPRFAAQEEVKRLHAEAKRLNEEAQAKFDLHTVEGEREADALWNKADQAVFAQRKAEIAAAKAEVAERDAALAKWRTTLESADKLTHKELTDAANDLLDAVKWPSFPVKAALEEGGFTVIKNDAGEIRAKLLTRVAELEASNKALRDAVRDREVTVYGPTGRAQRGQRKVNLDQAENRDAVEAGVVRDADAVEDGGLREDALLEEETPTVPEAVAQDVAQSMDASAVNVVGRKALAKVMMDPEGKGMFLDWADEHPDSDPFGVEVMRTAALWQLTRATPDGAAVAGDPVKLKAWFDAHGMSPMDVEDVAGFASRPHVKHWLGVMDQHVLPEAQRVRPPVPAGDDFLQEGGQPLIGTHRSKEPFDITKYDMARHGEQGATDFGPAVYLDTGAGWDDYGPYEQNVVISSKARVLDVTQPKGSGMEWYNKIEDQFQGGAYDVLIHRMVDYDGKTYISQVAVKNPKLLLPEAQWVKPGVMWVKPGVMWEGKAAKIELAPGLPSQLDNAVRVDDGGKVIALGKKRLPEHGLVLEANLEAFAGRDLEAMKLYYPEAWVGEGDARLLAEPAAKVQYGKGQKWVDVQKLVDRMREYPMMEVVMSGEQQMSPAMQSLDILRHGWYERLSAIEHRAISQALQVPKDEYVANLNQWVNYQTEGSSKGKDYWDNFLTKAADFVKLSHQVAEEPTKIPQVDYSGNYSISSRPVNGREIAVVFRPLPDGKPWPSDAHHDVPGLAGTATVEEKTVGDIRKVYQGANAPIDKTGKSVVSGMVLHTLRNSEDLNQVLSQGLRQGTNVSLDGGKPNQSIGNGITLVYAPTDVRAEPKGYNENDGLVTKGRGAKPKAILVESEEVSLGTRRTYSEDEIYANLQRLQLLQDEATKKQQADPNAKTDFYGRTVEVRNVERQLDEWYARMDSLLKAQEKDPTLKQEKGVSEEEAVQKLVGTLPKDVPAYLYDADENGNISNLRPLTKVQSQHPILKALEGKADDVKVLVQTEAQSDWAADRKEAVEDTKKNAVARQTPNGKWSVYNNDANRFVTEEFNTKAEAEKKIQQILDEAVPDHPSLPDWERLVTSATLDYARKNGYEFVGVTDAKTAAMTEGHDVVERDTYFKVKLGDKEVEHREGSSAHTDLNVPEIKGKPLSLLFGPKDGWIDPTMKLTGRVRVMAGYQREPQFEATNGEHTDSWNGNPAKLGLTYSREKVPQTPAEVKQLPGHAAHYGLSSPVGDIPATQGSLQREWEKVTGKAVGEGVAVGVHGKTQQGPHIVVGSPSLTDPHPLTGEIGPKVYATVNLYAVPQETSVPKNADRSNIKLPNMRNSVEPVHAALSPELQEVADSYKLGGSSRAPVEHLAQNGVTEYIRNYAKWLLDVAPDSLDRNPLRAGKSFTYARPWLRYAKSTGFIGTDHLIFGTADNTVHERAQLEYAILHETTHGVLDNALDRPENVLIREEVEALRQNVLKQQSREVREAVKLAEGMTGEEASQHIFFPERKGETAAERSARSRKDEMVYALSNVKEFMNYGLGPTHFRATLDTMPRLRKFFYKLVAAAKRLMGLDPTKESLLDELIHWGGVLAKNEQAVVKAHEYFESHFAARGYSATAQKLLAAKSLDFLYKNGGTSGTPNRKAMLHDLTRLLKTDEMPLTMKRAQRQLHEALQRTDFVLEGQDVVGKEPNETRLVDFLSDVLHGEVSADMVSMLPPEARAFVIEHAAYVKDVAEAVKAATAEGNRDVLDILHPEGLNKGVDDVLSAVRPVIDGYARDVQAVDQLGRLANFQHDRWFTMLEEMQPVQNIKRPPTHPADDVLPEPLWKVQKVIATANQLAAMGGPWAEWLSNMWTQNARSKHVAQMSWEVMGMKPGETEFNPTLADERTKWLGKKVGGRLPNTQAVNDVLAVNNLEGGNAVGILPETHPEIAKVKARMSAEDWTKTKEMVQMVSYAYKLQTQHTLTQMENEAGQYVAKIALFSPHETLKHPEAVKIGLGLVEGVRMLKKNPNDPVAMQKLQYAQAKLAPETYGSLLELADNRADQINAIEQHFEKNPGWVSARRTKKFKYNAWKGKEPVMLSADDKVEAVAHAKNNGYEIDWQSWKKNEREDYVPFGPGNAALAEQLKKHDDVMVDIMQRTTNMTPEELTRLRENATGLAFSRSLAMSYDVGGLPSNRTLKKGSELLPWLRNAFTWTENNSAYWNKRTLRAQLDTLLASPELRADTENTKLMQQHMEGFLSPDPETARIIQQAVGVFHLGGNVASAVVNLGQPLFRGVPELLRQVPGLGTFKAMKYMARAIRDFAKHKWNSKKYLDGAHFTEEERVFVDNLVRDGVVDATVFDEDMMKKADVKTNLLRALDGEAPLTTGKVLTRAAGRYAHVSMLLFRHGERANNVVTSLAAFRALRDANPQMTFKEAQDKARLMNFAVNDVGGRLNRPIQMFSAKEKPIRGAAMMATSLQNFTIGTVNQLLRYAKEAWGSKRLTAAEKFAARKAFVTQLAMQFTAAGALGLPFVGSVIALLNQFAPELEVNKNIREMMQQFWGEDEEDGGWVTNAAMTGVPSMLGWDLQSRLSNGNILPGVNEWNGFQAGQLLGVPLTTAGNIAGGLSKAVRGDVQGLMQLSPPAFRRLKDFVFDEGKALDYRDRPIFDMTPGERLGQAIGFQPKRLSDFNAAQRMLQQSEDADSAQKRRFRDKMGEEVLKGNFGTVMGELRQMAAADTKLDVIREVREIAKAAEGQAFPRDLRREARGTEKAKLLRLWNMEPVMPSEMERVLFRQRIQAQFGLRTVDQGALKEAQLMDELRAKNPDATRSELRAAVQHATGRTSRKLPWLTEPQTAEP